MKPEMTLEISENYRYAAYTSDYPFDYLKDYEWDSWGLYTIAISRDYRPLELDTFGINERLARVQNHYEFSWNSATLEIELQKAAKRAGYESLWITLQGYSQREWAYVFLYWNDEWLMDPSGLVLELEAWFRGDVYWVALEKLETYTSASGNTIQEWELIESVGDVIIHDDNSWSLETCRNLLGSPDKVAA